MKAITLSVNEAAELVGIRRTAFYWWRKRHGVEPVASSSKARPRYLRSTIEAACNNIPKPVGPPSAMDPMPQGQQQVSGRDLADAPPASKTEPVDLAELQRRASEAADYAARGEEWPPK